MDPENLILTDVGKAYIQQCIANDEPCVIGGFKLCDTHLFVPDITMTELPGTITYEGVPAEIFYIKYNENEMVLRCCLEPTIGDFLIGGAGIYSDTGVLLFVTAFSYTHHKMASAIASAGGRWTYQVRLGMAALFEHWSFDNLTLKYAKAETHDLASAPAFPYDSFHSEIQLRDCLIPTNRSGYLFLSGSTNREWYCSPFQVQMSDLQVKGNYQIDGGLVGDRYAYFS